MNGDDMLSTAARGRAMPAEPRLSVWATGQHDTVTQLADGGYLPPTARDTAMIPPAVAAHAVAAYTRPGDTVLDPDCGAGTAVAEALRSGRHAVGLTADPRSWALARANATAVKAAGAPADAMVLDGGPARLRTERMAGLHGRVDLVLTALRHPGRAHPTGRDTEDDQDGAGHARDLAELFGCCLPLLRSGARLVVVTRPCHRGGYLLDLPGRVLTAGREVGLVPAERCAALLAELRGNRLVVRASLAERRAAAARAVATGHPAALTAHLDVVVFQVGPQALAQVARLQPPCEVSAPASATAPTGWRRVDGTPVRRAA